MAVARFLDPVAYLLPTLQIKQEITLLKYIGGHNAAAQSKQLLLPLLDFDPPVEDTKR